MSKHRILIVEDEQIIQMDLQDRLERLGYEIAGVATSGPAAIEAAERENPDIILMDIRLQGEMDGVEAAQQIRLFHDGPLVYITAHAEIRTLGRAAGTEPYFYLIKPVRPEDLSAVLDTASEQMRLRG